MTLRIRCLICDTQHNDIQHIDIQHNKADPLCLVSRFIYHYAECCYARSVVMLKVIMLSIVMLSVVAPFLEATREHIIFIEKSRIPVDK